MPHYDPTVSLGSLIAAGSIVIVIVLSNKAFVKHLKQFEGKLDKLIAGLSR